MISQPGGRKISDISDFWPSFSYFHIFQSDRNASFFRFVISEGVGNEEKIIVLVVKANHKVLNGYSKNSYWIDKAERRKEDSQVKNNGSLSARDLFPPFEIDPLKSKVFLLSKYPDQSTYEFL